MTSLPKIYNTAQNPEQAAKLLTRKRKNQHWSRQHTTRPETTQPNYKNIPTVNTQNKPAQINQNFKLIFKSVQSFLTLAEHFSGMKAPALQLTSLRIVPTDSSFETRGP